MGNYYTKIFTDDYDIEQCNVEDKGSIKIFKDPYNPDQIPPNFLKAYKHSFANSVGKPSKSTTVACQCCE